MTGSSTSKIVLIHVFSELATKFKSNMESLITFQIVTKKRRKLDCVKYIFFLRIIKMKKILNLSILAVIITISNHVLASSYIVGGTTISVFAQSNTSGSTANLIKMSKPMYNGGNHPWCGNRAYINFADKELFSTALAVAMAKKPVNVMYEDAAESKVAGGHIEFGCKVTSIWWDV